MLDWQRRRHPDDVPTPVAVALSDFCRRAKAAPTPASVRDALSVLSADDDFRVRALVDEEPKAQPLGPFAVIDVLHGTEQATAAQREQTGYYALARELLGRSPLPKLAPVAAPPATPPTPVLAAKAEKPVTKARGKRQRALENVGPVRRVGGKRPLPAPPVQAAEVVSLFPPKRNLPIPRGRFVNVQEQRRKLDELFSSVAFEQIDLLVRQSTSRMAIFRALAVHHAGSRGPLTLADVEQVLKHHRVFDELEAKEREGVLSTLVEQRGSLGRAAYAFELSQTDLTKLVELLKLKREVDEIRERFVKEALSPKHVALRLELVVKEKYLSDLGIEKRFFDALARDLRALLGEPEGSVDDIIYSAARQHGLNAERLRRGLEKTGVLRELEEVSSVRS